MSRRASAAFSFRSATLSGATCVKRQLLWGDRRLYRPAAHHPNDLEPSPLVETGRVELVALDDDAIELDGDRERVDAEVAEVIRDRRLTVELARFAVDL